jgi:hypothetical protein
MSVGIQRTFNASNKPIRPLIRYLYHTGELLVFATHLRPFIIVVNIQLSLSLVLVNIAEENIGERSESLPSMVVRAVHMIK